MRFLEELLDKKSKLENTEIYLSQWIYDKEIYKDILSNIKDYYPNYTDHGYRHSETILNNIVRIFEKEVLESLSSFDIWLLLEAAYMHDCGMYISLEKAKSIFETDKFKTFFKNIKNQANHPLYEYTKKFEFNSEENKIKYIEYEYTPETEYGMRFIIASYMRSSHAENAGDVLKDRNYSYIIPQRIYKVLSLIVEAHNFDFEKIMKIPQKESGIGLEAGHPRFIACLLRVGDLLDIDNNRISPTILNNLQNIIPEDSKEHIKKHRSITHYRIDNKRIEITATIENDENDGYNIANITSQWFNFIENEFNNQLSVWDEIRPDNFFAYLPMLGELNVNLKGYDYINAKEKPKFTVDINNILGLLSGGGIYKNKETAMRELIQNSIDATLIRTYEEKRKEENSLEIDSLSEKLEILSEKKIRIDIKKNNSDNIHNYWEIIVTDKGIGFDKEKLKYIIEAGSSYKDTKKNDKIDKMPQWMSPSGNFGIGFQSIFLLTDEVTIETKGLYTNESLKVVLFSPSNPSKNRGDVFIKTLPFDYQQEIGTQISFIYKTEKNASSYSVSMGKNSLLNEYVESFDPFLQDEFDVDIIKLIDEIGVVNSYSLVDVELFHDSEKIELEKKVKAFKEELKLYKEYKVEILIPEESNLTINPSYNRSSSQKVYYKNQKIEKHNSLRFDYLNFIINIVGYKASEVLEINRDELKGEFFNKNYKEIYFALFKYIKEELEPKFSEFDEIFKLRISLFLRGNIYYYNEYIKNNEKVFSEIIDFYRSFKLINSEDENILLTYEKLKEYQEIEIEIRRDIKRSSDSSVTINGNLIEFNIEDIINWISEENNYIFDILKIKNSDEVIKKIVFKKINCKDDEKLDREYDKLISDIFNEDLYRWSFKKRFYIPSNGKYPKLKLSNSINCDQNKNYSWINRLPIESETYFTYTLYSRNKILFPFFIKENKFEKSYIWNSELKRKYINFQYENRFDKSLTKDEIKDEAEKFIEDMMNIIPKEIKRLES